jgi:hypothetical protein
MTTINRVEFGNRFTKPWKREASKVILDEKWLLENTFFIEGDWPKKFPVPGHVDLVMVINPRSVYGGEEFYLPLCKVKWDRHTDIPKEFRWFTGKQLIREIKSQIRYTCPKYADDFLPAALKIALNAQKQAERMYIEEARIRAGNEKKKKGVRKITKKKKC